MKLILISISTLSIISCLNPQEPRCDLNNCPKDKGECVDSICLCGAGYTTIEFENNKKESENFIFCNYDYKYNEYAAYFEALFPFGVGHFYSERYLHALLKFLLFWFVSSNRILFSKSIKLYPIIEKMNKYLLWVFGLAYITDYIAFSYNYYTDGNGIAFL
jgi:hypothetical protein